MNAGKTPLIGKLILLVALLNLACLLALLWQRKPWTNGQGQTVRTSPDTRQVEAMDETSTATPNLLPTRRPGVSSKGGTFRSRRTAASAELPPSDAAAEPVGSESAPPSSQSIAEIASATFVEAGPAALPGAQVTGRVWLVGTPPPEVVIRMDAFCGQLQTNPVTTRHYVVTEDGRLANVFVWIKEGLGDARYPATTNQPVLDNLNCQFEPYVMGLQTGQKFKIRNSDSLLHNVHATARINREFNIGLPVRDGVVERSFPSPEIFVRIICDVHPWMFAYIGIVAHPWFAVTDREGNFRLPAGLPPGRYVLAARHLKAGESAQEIELGEGGSRFVEFTLRVPGS